jgi:hypothetical protein
MDAEFVKFLGTLGVGGAIAGVLAVFYHRLAESHAKNWHEVTERWEKMTDDFREIVHENTVIFTKVLEALQQMQRQVERWDGHERRAGPRRPGRGEG